MSENGTEAQQQPEPEATEPEVDSTDWKAEARKWEQRAKDNSAKARDLEKRQQASMTEAERAVAEAEVRGRTAAATAYGQRLARTEFDALAGRRNPDYDTASALEFVDLSRFLTEDGEPDSRAIKAAVERLVPTAGAPSFDGGTRTTAAPKGDMSSMIRKAAGLG